MTSPPEQQPANRRQVANKRYKDAHEYETGTTMTRIARELDRTWYVLQLTCHVLHRYNQGPFTKAQEAGLQSQPLENQFTYQMINMWDGV